MFDFDFEAASEEFHLDKQWAKSEQDSVEELKKRSVKVH